MRSDGLSLEGCACEGFVSRYHPEVRQLRGEEAADYIPPFSSVRRCAQARCGCQGEGRWAQLSRAAFRRIGEVEFNRLDRLSACEPFYGRRQAGFQFRDHRCRSACFGQAVAGNGDEFQPDAR